MTPFPLSLLLSSRALAQFQGLWNLDNCGTFEFARVPGTATPGSGYLITAPLRAGGRFPPPPTRCFAPGVPNTTEPSTCAARARRFSPTPRVSLSTSLSLERSAAPAARSWGVTPAEAAELWDAELEAARERGLGGAGVIADDVAPTDKWELRAAAEAARNASWLGEAAVRRWLAGVVERAAPRLADGGLLAPGAAGDLADWPERLLETYARARALSFSFGGSRTSENSAPFLSRYAHDRGLDGAEPRLKWPIAAPRLIYPNVGRRPRSRLPLSGF